MQHQNINKPQFNTLINPTYQDTIKVQDKQFISKSNEKPSFPYLGTDTTLDGKKALNVDEHHNPKVAYDAEIQ